MKKVANKGGLLLLTEQTGFEKFAEAIESVGPISKPLEDLNDFYREHQEEVDQAVDHMNQTGDSGQVDKLIDMYAGLNDKIIKQSEVLSEELAKDHGTKRSFQDDDLKEKGREDKEKKIRVKQPFKMENEYGRNLIQNIDNHDIDDYHRGYEWMFDTRANKRSSNMDKVIMKKSSDVSDVLKQELENIPLEVSDQNGGMSVLTIRNQKYQIDENNRQLVNLQNPQDVLSFDEISEQEMQLVNEVLNAPSYQELVQQQSNIKKKAVSGEAYEIYEDVLEVCFAGDKGEMLESLISALGDYVLIDHLDYIKKMCDYDDIKKEMEG